jgi:hypothetical protein
MKVETFDIGNEVICDWCGEDYTLRNECGGLLFQSKACCPVCVPKIEALAVKYNEQEFIRGRCPEDMPFNKWCLSLRNENNTVTVRTF